jgi:glycosyltransferase involved in cell wall biosynthesis
MRPLVSIIEEFLPFAARWVRAQTYPNVEWLILDDSPSPSRVFAANSDPRIRYQHLPQRLSIGEKRNRLVAAARGEYIAHFDDDDYYAPRFLEAMISSLESNGSAFANLCSWYLFDVRHDLFGFWNLRQTTGLHFLCYPKAVGISNFTEQNNAALVNNHLGFGFTYVYRRRVWEANQFPARDWGEDTEFVAKAAAAFPVISIEDQTGLVLHVLHAGSTSSCFPQFHLPPFMVHSLFAPYQELLDTLRQRRAAERASAPAISLNTPAQSPGAD